MVRFYMTLHMESGNTITIPTTLIRLEEGHGGSRKLVWDQGDLLFKLRSLEQVNLSDVEAVTTFQPFRPVNWLLHDLLGL